MYEHGLLFRWKSCALMALSLTLLGTDGRLLEGRVLDPDDQPIAGIEIRLDDQQITQTDATGRYAFAEVARGTHRLEVRYYGQMLTRSEITIDGPETLTHDITLTENPVWSTGLVVTSTRTGNPTETQLAETRLQRMRATVTGELLREINGVEAVRRGPVGLDPVVRGLRETEVGLYLDGTRMFPAGPGRMDSGLSHTDPSAIDRIQVVKGPYALSWGAGNMAAIRAHTPNPLLNGEGIGGNLNGGATSNTEATYLSTSVEGRADRLGYWAHLVTRSAGDYEDGDGAEVPGDLTTRELRLKLAYRLDDNQTLSLAAGRQEQRDIDYPGRLLNADFFDTDNLSLTWQKRFSGSGPLRDLEARIYDNRVDHGMGNWEKPTASPNPNRIPPFAIDVDVQTHAYVTGGRIALGLAPVADVHLELGTDFYHVNRDATRTISRAENGAVLFADKMWPDADIDVLGAYAMVETRSSATWTATGTLRLDLVEADAGETSQFFADNTTGEIAASETNASGSVMLTRRLDDAWSLSFGLGSVARTADATERYSDRIPSTRAQTSAEFMGNPELDPERANQIDVILEGNRAGFQVTLSGFAREIDDYITLEPTDLPKRLPMSPNTVYRYINGEARFHGAELSLAARSPGPWQARFSAAYLHGDDETLDEPVLGIAPLNGRLELGYLIERLNQAVWLDLHAADEQDRVATTRFETPTDGYATVDLTYSLEPFANLTLRMGVDNLTDEAWVNHLNAKNPFTGQLIAEPGRRYHLDIRFRF